MNTWSPAVRRSLHHALTHPAVRLGLRALAVSAVVLSGVSVHGWIATREVSALQNLLEERHRSLAAAARTRALHNAYHEAMQRLAEHDRGRPPPSSGAERPSQAQLVQAITQLGHRSGLTLLNEAYDPLHERGLSGWRVSLTAQADYPAVRAFVGGLSTLAVPVHAQRVRIDATRHGERALIGAAAGAVIYAARAAYVGEPLSWKGAAVAAGAGFAIGTGAALLPGTAAVLGAGATGYGAGDVAMRAGNYSNLSPQEQRALHFDAGMTALGAAGTVGLAGRAGAVGSATKGVATGAESAVDSLKLNKSLASQAQMGEAGTTMAGAGSRVPFRDSARIAKEHGGSAADWVKKSSSSHIARDGTKFETHWVENVRNGQRVEFKTKFPGDD